MKAKLNYDKVLENALGCSKDFVQLVKRNRDMEFEISRNPAMENDYICNIEGGSFIFSKSELMFISDRGTNKQDPREEQIPQETKLINGMNLQLQLYGNTISSSSGGGVSMYTLKDKDMIYTKLKDGDNEVKLPLIRPSNEDIQTGKFEDYIQNHLDLVNETLRDTFKCEGKVSLTHFTGNMIYQLNGLVDVKWNLDEL